MLNRKCILASRWLLLAVALLALTAQAQVGPGPRGTARFDQWVSQEVNHQLVMLPWYSVFDNLQYKVNGSEVTLLGQVVQPTTKSEAEKRVKGIEGVTKVINNVEVLPLSPDDDRIRRAEYRAIFSEPALEKYSLGSVQPVHIVVKGGHVTLEGSVLNEGDKNLIGIRANGVPGTFSVTNNLRIENSKTQTEESSAKH
jgi:hyperosmotically inducible periplasmic protein